MNAAPSCLSPRTPVEYSAQEIADAYRCCQRVTRHHAKSFYFCAQFLPRHKRRAIYAMYALCRHIDDAVDEAGISNEDEARLAVADWRTRLDATYRGDAVADPVLIAWSDMLRSYAIKKEYPLELMRGVLMDTYINRYETWDELRLYCYRVASIVGLMSSEIFGYTEPQTLRYAEALGLAMQLTNILRDIGEDAAMGRVYLPQEDLRRFGYGEDELLNGKVNARFVALMDFEMAHARALYAEAEHGIALLHRDAHFTVLLAARLYARILARIEETDYNVFSRRAHMSLRAKIHAAPRIWWEARRLENAAVKTI